MWLGDTFNGVQQLASFANPITTGSLTFALLGKASVTVPAATDYSDVLTVSLTLSF